MSRERVPVQEEVPEAELRLHTQAHRRLVKFTPDHSRE